jgi:dTDP-glucose pyrophosphorylase
MNLAGVILAAGKGSRIAPLNQRWPKPLLPVCNKSIIEYQIDAMRSLDVDQVYIVVGHLGDVIQAALGDGSRLGVQIQYVEQKDPQGIAHALLTLDGLVQDPMVVFLGDIFLAFHKLPAALERFQSPGVSGVLVVKHEPIKEYIRRNFAVIMAPEGRVIQVIEKPEDPPNDLKGCGVYFFQPTIFEALRRTPRSSMRNEYEITDAIQIFIDMGEAVYTAATVKWDMNLTYPQDLVECNLRVLAEQGGGSRFGENVIIHPRASIISSVIGSNARIVHPIRVERSLVLEGAMVREKQDLVGALVIRDQVLWRDGAGPVNGNCEWQGSIR